MSYELEKWQPEFVDNADDLVPTADDEVIDVGWQPVDDVDDYSVEPIDNDNGWNGGSWLQRDDDTPLTTYAEPEVIDTPFTFLEPEPDKAPVKRSGWGGGWFNSDSTELDTAETDSSELERYTSAHLESEPETQTTYWQPIGERDALPSDTGGIPTPDWWAQTTTATSQATDTFTDVATSSKTKSKQRTDNGRRREPDALDAMANWLGLGGGSKTPQKTASSSGSSQPATAMQGSGSSQPDYGWYFIAQDDPREDPDVWRLRHWYFQYEFADGFEEWDEAKFHEWMQSLDRSQYQLYAEAGQTLMDNELVDNLKDGQLKTAYLSMRLEGDSPDSERNDVLGRVSAAILRGFSK